jgi:hypothetical protein
MSETETKAPLEVSRETRNKAYSHLFDFDYDETAGISTVDNWIEPADAEDRLKAYIDAEIDFARQEVHAARPGYNTEAQSRELLFQNASNYMETGERGKAGFEKVLDRLHKERRQMELDYAFNDPKSKDKSMESNLKHALLRAQEYMITHIAEKHFGDGKRIEYLGHPKSFKNTQY